jgi:hypothetical protein
VSRIGRFLTGSLTSDTVYDKEDAALGIGVKPVLIVLAFPAGITQPRTILA